MRFPKTVCKLCYCCALVLSYRGGWPKASLLSKACQGLLFYGTCGLYYNFSVYPWLQMGHIPSPCCSRTNRLFGSLYSHAQGPGAVLRSRKLTSVIQHRLSQAKAAAVFSASHCGWSGAETQSCLCNGQHSKVLGSDTTVQLHPGPQVGKSFWEDAAFAKCDTNKCLFRRILTLKYTRLKRPHDLLWFQRYG